MREFLSAVWAAVSNGCRRCALLIGLNRHEAASPQAPDREITDSERNACRSRVSEISPCICAGISGACGYRLRPDTLPEFQLQREVFLHMGFSMIQTETEA